MIACVALGVVAAHEPTRDDTMEYFGLGEAEPPYDCTGATVADVVVAFSEHRPLVYGPCPFYVSSTVIRDGKRDVSPPAVERTPADLAALAHALSVHYPGAVVPPVGDASDAGRGAQAAKTFIERCLQHEELGPSSLLVEFLLQREITRSVRNASHIGSDVAVRATTTATFYGSDVKKDVEDARRWCLAKEKILDDATARATKAERAIRKATKETAHLLATGGVLLNPRDDDAAAGVVSASWAFRDLKHQVGSLRDAAATVQTLRDRLAAAEGILEATRESFASSKEKSTAARAFSKSQRDVDSDTARRNAIESVVDNASRRFAHDASAFVASFPDKWSTLVATLVADQARAARDGASLLEAAHASGAAKAAPASPAASDMWPPPPPGSRKLIDTWRKNGEAPASPESPATVPESDSDAPLEAAEAPDPTPAPAPATRPQGISNNDDAPAWAHSPTGDHSPRARRNAWGAASTSGLPSWASTPPTEPEPSWAEDGIRPPKV